MPLGVGAFVDVREGPNIRQTFDGVRVHVPFGRATLDLFEVRQTHDRSARSTTVPLRVSYSQARI